MTRLAIAATLLLAACATTAAAPEQRGPDRATARIQRTLAGLTPSAPQRCLSRDKVNEIRTAEGVILYVAGRNRVWRNNIVGGCAGLSRGDIVVSTGTAGQICNGDIVQTRARLGGQITGSCSLGEFVPYTR